MEQKPQESNATGYVVAALLYVSWLIAKPISALVAGGVVAVGYAVWLLYDACWGSDRAVQRAKERDITPDEHPSEERLITYEDDDARWIYDPTTDRYLYHE